MLTNNSFSFNQVEDETIDIYSSILLTIESLICQHNNNVEDQNCIRNGGCLRTFNSLSRILKNIIIADSLSNQKAIGIKIIDDAQSLKENYIKKFGNPLVIMHS